MKSNYLEELNAIFHLHQIPLEAQKELRDLFKVAVQKAQYASWGEGFESGRLTDWS